MQEHTVDKTLTFTFSDDWHITKCDEWNFYRNKFASIRHDKDNGVKSIDVLAFDTQKTLWFIEVKDYRQHTRTKDDLPHIELRNKVFDTLAMLIPASCNAGSEEKDFAMRALQCKKLRIVYHFEQPVKHSKLFPRAFDLADIQAKLRQCLKSVDPHPVVMDIQSKPASIPWEVR